MPEYREDQHPRGDGGRWSEQARFRNEEDIGAYRDRPYRSIWDGTGYDPYGEESEEDRRAREAQSELDQEEDERRRRVGAGWFGGDYEDMSDSRWGAERNYVHDERGLPKAQHGHDSPKIKHASRTVKYRGPEKWGRDALQKKQRFKTGYRKARHPIKHQKKKQKKRFFDWWKGSKKVYSSRKGGWL